MLDHCGVIRRVKTGQNLRRTGRGPLGVAHVVLDRHGYAGQPADGFPPGNAIVNLGSMSKGLILKYGNVRIDPGVVGFNGLQHGRDQGHTGQFTGNDLGPQLRAIHVQAYVLHVRFNLFGVLCPGIVIQDSGNLEKIAVSLRRVGQDRPCPQRLGGLIFAQAIADGQAVG